MNILFCYMYQSVIGPLASQSSADGMVRGFKKLGHDVLTCGPDRGNFSGELTSMHDIPVYDKPDHPETYTYSEIIKLYQEKTGIDKPDLIIQTDPHFYLIGDKPKDITSVYWIMDVHRGPIVFRRMAKEGNFDKIFIAQKYYMPVFERIGLDCEYLTWAYDDELVYEEPEIDYECDISFVGNTGLPNQDDWFIKNNYKIHYDPLLGLHYINLDEYKMFPEDKYVGWYNRSMEYAERIEYLCRLSKDFNVRVYQRCFDLRKVSKILSRGKIGFHHSLRRDITLKMFEVPAVNRLLLADEIPNLSEVMTDGVHFKSFRQYYQPQFAGFDLDYEEIKNLVDYYLKYNSERVSIAKQGMIHVKNNHTFKNRAEEMLKVLNNG